jgi:hypothetical protein
MGPSITYRNLSLESDHSQELPKASSQVWVAICASSSEGSTRIEQRDVGLLMGSSKDRFRHCDAAGELGKSIQRFPSPETKQAPVGCRSLRQGWFGAPQAATLPRRRAAQPRCDAAVGGSNSSTQIARKLARASRTVRADPFFFNNLDGGMRGKMKRKGLHNFAITDFDTLS